MRAERDSRAAILTAEGVKQSQILTAEGEKQSSILRAEGAREAEILRAQGQSKAIEQVFAAIHEGDADPKLLAYQYLQTLPKIAQGESEQGVDHPERGHPGAGQHRLDHPEGRDRGARRGASGAAGVTRASSPAPPGLTRGPGGPAWSSLSGRCSTPFPIASKQPSATSVRAAS